MEALVYFGMVCVSFVFVGTVLAVSGCIIAAKIADIKKKPASENAGHVGLKIFSPN